MSLLTQPVLNCATENLSGSKLAGQKYPIVSHVTQVIDCNLYDRSVNMRDDV